jgi:hypothetical protein
MKEYVLVLIMVLFSVACASRKSCSCRRSLIKSVDTTGTYRLRGKYCFNKTTDTTLGSNFGAVSFKGFNRMNGDFVPGGFLTFWGVNGFKLRNKSDEQTIILPEGTYRINVSYYDFLPITILDVKVERNKKVNLSIYLGGSVIP